MLSSDSFSEIRRAGQGFFSVHVPYFFTDAIKKKKKERKNTEKDVNPVGGFQGMFPNTRLGRNSFKYQLYTVDIF